MEAITAKAANPFLSLLLTNGIAFSQELRLSTCKIKKQKISSSFQLQRPETPDENCAPIKQFKRNEVWQPGG